jgi:hypothetical protein
VGKNFNSADLGKRRVADNKKVNENAGKTEIIKAAGIRENKNAEDIKRKPKAAHETREYPENQPEADEELKSEENAFHGRRKIRGGKIEGKKKSGKTAGKKEETSENPEHGRRPIFKTPEE